MQHPARAADFEVLYDSLQKAMRDGHVRENGHGALRLYCYTSECVYNQAWDETTTLARGLVLDIEQRRVVATPFIKFFNLHENTGALPAESFDIFEKLDGSMITLFFHDGAWHTATKGHLRSPQAIWALEWLQAHDLSHLERGCTYLCEAIYDENRIVIKYQGEGLRLLAAYDAHGYEVPYDAVAGLAQKLGWGIAQRFSFESLAALVETARKLPATSEGFILRYENGFRIKIKGEEYCRLHRLISNCTPLTVWEYMNEGKDPLDMRRELPEEFWADFDSILSALNSQRHELQNKIRALAESLSTLTDKDVGLKLGALPADLRGYIFPYRKAGGDFESGKIRQMVMRSIRPAANQLEGYTPSIHMYRVHAEST
ncbi:MAG: 2'-5' RNA ligase [Alphaproteobacteria bacterium]|nr:2'-5' RNA ligase [Alphaproteobacteria bacterium]